MKMSIVAVAVTAVLLLVSTVAGREHTCARHALEVAGRRCGYSLPDFAAAANSADAFATMCDACLPSIAVERSDACPIYRALSQRYDIDCRVCNPLSARRSECLEESELCGWNEASQRCYAVAADDDAIVPRRLRRGSAMVGLGNSGSDWSWSSSSNSFSCEVHLLQPAANTSDCGFHLLSLTKGDDHSCGNACGFCLSAVMSVAAGTCSAFASIQTSCHSQCQQCATTTAAPMTTTAGPETTAEATTTAAATTLAPGGGNQQTPTPTSEQTPNPTSEATTAQPTTAAPSTPAPTTAVPCEAGLLEQAGHLCKMDLSELSDGHIDKAKGNVCSTCLSAILTLSAGTCQTYALIQALVQEQCHPCGCGFTPAPTTEAPPTEAPTTVAPTTVAPTTVAPTTVAPTTVAPTTVAPTTVAPTTVAPTTVAPTTEVPTTAVPTAPQITPNPATEAPPAPVCNETTPAPFSPAELPPCESVLLQIAGAACDTDLGVLVGGGSLPSDTCQGICCTCLSTLVLVPACDCPSFAAIQHRVSKQCLTCSLPSSSTSPNALTSSES